MSRDGTGRYLIPGSSWYPPINGNQATAADWKKTIEDVANALTQSVSSDGQTAMVGPLNMGNNRIRGLNSAQGNNDALRRLQIMKGADITPEMTATIPNEGNFFDMNGTGTVQGFSTPFPGRQVWIRFSDGITLKNSTELQLPNNQDWATENGQFGLFLQTDDENWKCIGRWPAATGTAADADLVTSAYDSASGRVTTTGWMGLGGNALSLAWSNTPQTLPYTGFNAQYSPNNNPPAPIESTYGQYFEFGSLQWRSRIVHSHTGNRLWHAWSTNAGAFTFDEIWTSRSFNPATKANTNATVASFAGNFPWARVSDKPSVYPTNWANIANIPATANRWPSTGEVTGSWPWNRIASIPATAIRWPVWGEVTDKPAIPPTNQSIAHGSVGQYAMVTSTNNTGSWGATKAGSELRPCAVPGGNSPISQITTALAGTWRILAGPSSNPQNMAMLAVRIS